MARLADIEILAEDGAGEPVNTLHMTDLTLQVVGTFDATLQPELSLDRETWVALGDPITTAGVYQLTSRTAGPALTLAYLRISTSDYVSGEPTGILAGGYES